MGNDISSFIECWISQKWKWMEKTSWNQTLGGKHLVVEWILSLAEYVNFLPTVPTKTSRFAEYICSLPVLIFELSCPTGYLRVKHVSLMSSRVFVAFLLCDIGALMGLTECLRLIFLIVMVQCMHRAIMRHCLCYDMAQESAVEIETRGWSHVGFFSPNLTSVLPAM